MVVISDRLSAIIEKGEVVDRYYNPGDVFDEVHIVLTNDDRPDPDRVRLMVGKATLTIHNLHRPSFFSTLGWQLPLLETWVRAGLSLAEQIGPDMVRTHNNLLEGYLAARIKSAMNIPFVMSLHYVFDRDGLYSLPRRLRRAFFIKFERISTRAADTVIAVYQPLVDYAKRLGARSVELIYNAVAGNSIKLKENYDTSRRLRLITINRQFEEKNPENIIRAVADIDCEYLIVGDGPYHERLNDLVQQLQIGSKVSFAKAIPNRELCESLHEYDLMVAHCDMLGISKSTIEAALAGLPIVLNSHPQNPVPEYNSGWLVVCENSVAGYRAAISRFVEDASCRAEFGRKARTFALANFQASEMESRAAGVYRTLLPKNSCKVDIGTKMPPFL